ncbi:ABC transporter permease [Bacillota bacterium Meth-B3]
MSFKQMFYRRRWVSRLTVAAALIVLWAAAARFSGLPPMLLPSPAQVAQAFWRDLLQGALAAQTLTSLGVIGLGLFISVALSLFMAVAARQSPFLDRVFDALSALMHPLPGMAIMPLIVIWFGTGAGAVTFVIVHACLWPLYASILTGMRGAPTNYADIGRNYAMSPARIALEILLPAALSQVLSGLRISWARAWRALISAEMVFGAIGPHGGLGWFIFKHRAMMNTAALFAGIIAVAAVGMAVEGLLFERLEARTLRKWEEEQSWS